MSRNVFPENALKVDLKRTYKSVVQPAVQTTFLYDIHHVRGVLKKWRQNSNPGNSNSQQCKMCFT
jgi:hypothetical protein